MLKYFLQAYHQGYQDGLDGKAATSPQSPLGDDQRTERKHPSELMSRPAYHAGLLEGDKDRLALSTRPVSSYMTREEEADARAIDYIQAAEFLHWMLQDVSEILQYKPQNAEALVIARRCLQTILTQMEPLGEDPGEAWRFLAVQQRWGYLRLVSCLGTATHLLQQANFDVL